MSSTTTKSGNELVDFLSRPAAYPDPPRAVRIIETHISWIFLTNRFAYKLKKPVRFEFLDFSTLPRRHRVCEDEVRLNRRLTTDVYLGVLPITRDAAGDLHLEGLGEIVDYVVQMRRLPADMAVDAMLRSGTFRLWHARRISERLAKFYSDLAPATISPANFRRALEHHIRANGDDLLRALPLESSRVRRVRGAQLQFLHLESDLFDERHAAGRIVEGHGDLRPEHIYLTDPIAVIDCVEFSREMRTLDVADELSFLAIECELLVDGQLGPLAIAEYERSAGDRIPPRLLAFYKSYRACVRAKVSALRGQQESEEPRRSATRQAHRYLDWAEYYAAQISRPLLVLVGGLMGSGKSTLARKLADLLGAELISTDHIRQALLGRSRSPAPFGEGNYRPELQERVYDELNRHAERALCGGRSVVLDGTFLARARRQSVRNLAARHRVASLSVVCSCPRETALARLRSRAQFAASESEARPDLYDEQAARDEPPAAGEATVVIDTTRDVDSVLPEVLDHLKSLHREHEGVL